MPQTVSAVYERGVFRPSQRVELEDGEEVTIAIRRKLPTRRRVASNTGRKRLTESTITPLDRASLAAMDELWDNEADAVYDDCRALYDVSER